MKKVIVFGAGASVDFGVPTMDRFIDTADDLRSGSGEINKAHFDLFFDVIHNRLRQLHAKSAVDLDNIESVFGLVEMASLLRRMPGFDESQIDDLSEALRTVLVETIIHSGKFAYSRERQWDPPSSYLSVARQFDKKNSYAPEDALSLITFNYDLGLDFALHWLDDEIDYGLGRTNGHSGVPLYKLHGSLNWVTCKKCGTVRAIPLEQVFRAHAGRRSMTAPSTTLPLDPRRAHSVLGPHCEGDTQPFKVGLVPPSWNKTQYWRQLSSVWAAAAKEIASAHELVVIGYSMPESDSFFRDLLALGLEGPTRIRSLQVVNPNGQVGSRFERLLGPETRGRFRSSQETFRDWVNRTYGPSQGVGA
jgi:hypothetical protein